MIDNYIKIKSLFSNNSLIFKDTINGYTQHNIDGFRYSVKGINTDKRNFLIIHNNILYILNYKGICIDKIHKNTLLADIPDIDKYWMDNIEQISNNLYSFIIVKKDINDKTCVNSLLICKIVNHSFKLVERYSLLQYGIIDDSSNLNKHAYIYKDPGHVYLYTQNMSDGKEIIQEQKDNKVIWQWESTDCLELYNNIIRYNNQLADSAIHLNYFKELSNFVLLISFRNVGLAVLDKLTNKILWVINTIKNDLNMEAPCLSHYIEFLNTEKTKFAIFNNNWYPNSDAIETILNDCQIKQTDFDNLTTSSIIIYDLENKSSKKYNTSILPSPRQGNINYLKDNIFDINYGTTFIKDNNILYRYGLLEEKDLETDEIFFSMKLDAECYIIRRGL